MDATPPTTRPAPDTPDAPDAHRGRRWASFVRRAWPATIFLGGAATVLAFGAGEPEGGMPVRSIVVGAGDAPAGDGDVVLSSLEAETTATLVAGLTPEEIDAPGEIVLMEVTAYCPCQKCCGQRARGVTASGLGVDHNGGLFVAADTDLFPFGTRLVVPGYGSPNGEVVEVIDRGGAIKGMRLDVYYPDHKTALKWGRQVLPVRVLPPTLK